MNIYTEGDPLDCIRERARTAQQHFNNAMNEDRSMKARVLARQGWLKSIRDMDYILVNEILGTDGVAWYEAKEATSKTLFAHDLNAVIPSGNDADVLEAIKHGIRLQRSAEYPPMQDYLDGVAKDDADQIAAYKAACLAVKAKYPFPEQS
jgi:hypothetical protein